MTDTTTADELRDWLAVALGGSVHDVKPLEGSGLSREMWSVMGVAADGSSLDGIVKRDTGRGPLSGTMFTPGREALAIRAAGAAGIAAPRVLAISDDGRMFVMARLAGSPDLDADADPDHRAVRDSFVAQVAALHRLDVRATDLPGLDDLPTVASALRANIAAYRDVYAGLTANESVVDDAFALALEAAPGDDAAPVLVHGDLGPGNFLFENETVTGLIDWEMWHLGDPMDDLASLWFRKCVLRRDGDLAEWFGAYRAASGRDLDEAKLGYYRMLTMLRVVTAVLVMQEKDPARDEAVAALMLPLLADLVRSTS